MLANEPLDSVINSLNLKEVVVTAKKVKQRGDTISFIASAYIKKNDKVLEDLLKKMSGIEVMANGQVKYNGQWISEFYIEGTDMIGDNYYVATKNIDAQSIGSVQILENHQDKKILQGSQRGTAPAMNIRLKQTAKGAWASTLSAVLGTQPDFSCDISLTLMIPGHSDDKANGTKYFTFSSKTSLGFWPLKQLSFNPSLQYNYNDYFDERRNNIFFNCIAEYYLKDTMIFMKCYNLLDSKDFRRIADNGKCVIRPK